MQQFFDIGVIVNTQGIKGEVRVLPSTSDISRFEQLKTVDIFIRNDFIKLNIEKVWYHKQFVIIKFTEINSMNEGERLKNAIIKVPIEQGIPLDADEYYTRDLFDMNVYTLDGEHLGFISQIIETGANDVYVIKSENNDSDLLIPAIKKCIISVDVDKKRMTVQLIEGLR